MVGKCYAGTCTCQEFENIKADAEMCVCGHSINAHAPDETTTTEIKADDKADMMNNIDDLMNISIRMGFQVEAMKIALKTIRSELGEPYGK